MKTQGWKILGIIGLPSVLAFALSANAQTGEGESKTVWLARISGQTQCPVQQQPPSLSSAVDELERTEAVVLEAKLGSLKDQAFCDACSCPRNLYHVAKVNADQAAMEIAFEEGWNVVDPQNVGKPSLPELKR